MCDAGDVVGADLREAEGEDAQPRTSGGLTTSDHSTTGGRSMCVLHLIMMVRGVKSKQSRYPG